MSIPLTNYRLFGRTGVKVSPLTLGCMMFGRRTELAESVRIIDRALDAGINFLDTANAYTRGRSEEFTGEALRRNGKRKRVFLASTRHARRAILRSRSLRFTVSLVKRSPASEVTRPS